jgi:hypothetical protein
MTTAQRIVKIMELIEREEWEHEQLTRVGLDASKVEAKIYALRNELADLRKQTGMTWGRTVTS